MGAHPGRRLKAALLIAALVIVLAGAAYLAMQFVFPGTASSLGLAVIGVDGKPAIRLQAGELLGTRVPELPAKDPDVNGSLTDRMGNSLMVNIMNKGNGDSSEDLDPNYEVVITRDTRVYRDATLDSVTKQDSIQNLNMVVEPMAVENIHTGDIIHAWGEIRGDRLVATVVLVRINPPKIDPLNAGSEK